MKGTSLEEPQPSALVDHLVKLDVSICALLKRFDTFVQAQAAQGTEPDERASVVTLLEDAQHTMTEAVGALHSTMTEVLAHLQRLTELLSAVAGPLGQIQPHGWRLVPRSWWGMLVGLGLAVAALGWWYWPDPRWRPLALQVDATLVKQWSSLSEPLQEELQAIYRASGVRTVGERQPAPSPKPKAETSPKPKGR